MVSARTSILLEALAKPYSSAALNLNAEAEVLEAAMPKGAALSHLQARLKPDAEPHEPNDLLIQRHLSYELLQAQVAPETASGRPLQASVAAAKRWHQA